MKMTRQGQATPEGFSVSPDGFIFVLNACGILAISVWLFGTSNAAEWVQTMPTVSLIVCVSHLPSVLLQEWRGWGGIPSIFVPFGGLCCVAATSVLLVYVFATTQGAMASASPNLWFACAGSIAAFAMAVAIGRRRLIRGVRAAFGRIDPTRRPPP